MVLLIAAAIVAPFAARPILERIGVGGIVTPSPRVPPVLVGAGDIADCALGGDEATAALLDAIPGTVFTAGDNAYHSGTAEEYARCYEPTWGRHKGRTRPAPGNHDRGSGYFDYFGPVAGRKGEGFYSYDLAEWHIIVLNSNCRAAGGCEAGSGQELWLRADLKAHPSRCTLAIWHEPLFSSGVHGSNRTFADFWRALYDADADVVINAHDHDYERFAPQTPDGAADLARGLREFIVGTGGGPTRGFPKVVANSEVRDTGTHGVLRLTLHAGQYSWEFVPVAGETFTDSGSYACH